MSEPDDSGQSPDNPLSSMFGSLDIGAALRRLADLLSGADGPVNWKLARETALATAGASDPGTTTLDTDQVAEAMRLADVWLDPTTALPSGVTATEAWSRRRWVEATLPTWTELCDPVAGRVAQAMAGALPEEIRGLAGPMLGVLQQVGGLMFGGQLGQALGQLATEVVSSTDIGLPLGPAGRAALLPLNVGLFGQGLEVPAEEVRLFLALREAAHHRLFGHVPWLRGHLVEAVRSYAQGINVDPGAIEAAVRELDPSDPDVMNKLLGGGLFQPETTPSQQAALTRLETLLALVEGWVDDVVRTAADGHLPAAAALAESVRRRRAVGGPAEQTFATLVGLELRPRRARDAAALWQATLAARGVDGRDAIWGHPDLLPGPTDLDDPAGYPARAAAAEELFVPSSSNSTPDQSSSSANEPPTEPTSTDPPDQPD
jgi:putative hydrolase